MQIAQRLYEGVDVGDGAAGLITYMRTDGVDLAPEAVAAARRVIGKDFGDAYVPAAPRKYTAKAKNAQEAHEAIRPTDMTRRPRDVARHLEPEQAKLYELIWTRTIASQMESAELERTTVDILAEAGARKLEFRATGQVVRFRGLPRPLPGRPRRRRGRGVGPPAGDAPGREARQGAHRRRPSTSPSRRPATPRRRWSSGWRSSASAVPRPTPRPSRCCSDRAYVRLDKKRLFPEDKGRLVTAFLESFFAKYVGYDFTADLEEKLDQVSNSEIDWKALLRDFWNDFSGAVDGTKDLGTRQVLDSLNELLGPHIFPARGDGVDPRLCPLCGKGQLSLKLGKFGAFIGCSRYPECKFSRVLAPTGAESAEGDRPGVRVLGQDPETGDEITLRNGRFGDYVQQGEGEKPKRSSLPRGLSRGRRHAGKGARAARAAARGRAPSDERRADPRRHRPLRRLCPARQDLRQSRPRRRRARDRRQSRDRPHRRQGERRGRLRASAGARGRVLGEHPEGGTVSVKQGRFGAYVNHGKINATHPEGNRPGEPHPRRRGGAA